MRDTFDTRSHTNVKHFSLWQNPNKSYACVLASLARSKNAAVLGIFWNYSELGSRNIICCFQTTQARLFHPLINDTDFVTTDRDILSECTAFYKNLYTSKKPDSLQSTFFSEVNSTSLTNEEQSLCEGPLTEMECLEALKKMESDKTPGTDGLPAEFYKVFFFFFFGKTFLFF